MLEVQGNAQKLLEAVFEITITEEAAVSILDSYPELVWLANCLRRCPLPPGWTAMEIGTGRFKYVDMGTGATAEVSPLMQRFADLGRLMLHWRQNPSAEAEVAAALGNKRDQDNEDAARARKVWKGPHTDPKTGAEFWHCPATGRSTWGDPGMAAEFLARISDRLQKALPSTGKEEVSSAPENREDSQKPAQEAQEQPATPLAERQSEVRDMMKEFVSAAKPPAACRPKMPRPNTGRSRPASPAPPNAPRGQPGSSASELSLTQVGEDMSQDMRARYRTSSTSREREPSEEPMGRVTPGHNLTGEFGSDMTPRREFRRRRLDSSERLDPLASPNTGDCANRPASSRGPTEPEPTADRPEPGSAQALLAPAFEPGNAVVSDRSDFPLTDRRPGTGARPGTGKKGSRPPSRSRSASGEDGRPTTRRGGNSEPEVMTLGGTFGKNPMASSFNGTGGFGLSNTAMERMCEGAIAAAFDQAFGETSPGVSAEMDEDVLQDDDDQSDEDGGEEPDEKAVDLSMSLMSVCGPRSPSPKKVRAPLSPHAESPSIIVLEGEEPIWTSHKPLPKPKTPPRSARSEKKERAVLLGVPEPLSARGAARCDVNGAPLSARYHRPRPGNRRGSAGGA